MFRNGNRRVSISITTVNRSIIILSWQVNALPHSKRTYEKQIKLKKLDSIYDSGIYFFYRYYYHKLLISNFIYFQTIQYKEASTNRIYIFFLAIETQKIVHWILYFIPSVFVLCRWTLKKDFFMSRRLRSEGIAFFL